MPVRDSIFTTPKPIDATVTLTRESTGETEILKDSLFLLPQGYYAWNYWTDTPLLPEEEYTIRAEAPDGRFSQGTGVIPKNFPDPEINFDERDQSFRITIDAMVERLVVAQINYAFIITYDNGHPPTYNPYYPVNYIKDVIHKPNGSYQFTANIVPNIALQYSVDTNHVYLIGDELIIVSADSNWPDKSDTKSGVSDLPNSSNIENGLGMVTGIVSKHLPLLE